MAPETKQKKPGRARSSEQAPAAETPRSPLEQWKGRAGPHRVTLCLGTQVEFRLLSLEELVLAGALPKDLRELVALHYLNLDKGGLDAVLADAVVKSAAGEEGQQRLDHHVNATWLLNKTIAARSLVAINGQPVEITDPTELDGVPVDELAELVRLATGRQAFDSRGVRIGVEPLHVLARFHELHGIAGDGSDCEACTALRNEASSVHVGAV